MKKYIVFLCIVLFSVSLYSEKAGKKKESPISETTDELENKYAAKTEMEKLKKELTKEIDSLSKKLEENNRPFAIQVDAINVPSIALTFLLFLITLIFVSMKNNKLTSLLKLTNKEISELKKQVLALSNSTELKELRNRFTSISEDIKNIKDDLNNIDTRMNQSSVTGNKHNESYPQKVLKENYDEYFFSSPTSNGDFTDTYKKKTYIPNESTYRFLINKTGTDAKFSFIDDEAAIKTAIRIASSYIEPVCENINPRNPSAKSIKTVTPGTAVKEGNIWKVTKKAKIEYV